MNFKELTFDQIYDIAKGDIEVKDFINCIVLNKFFKLELETICLKGGTALYKQEDELGRM